jgi:hypothetical protein
MLHLSENGPLINILGDSHQYTFSKRSSRTSTLDLSGRCWPHICISNCCRRAESEATNLKKISVVSYLMSVSPIIKALEIRKHDWPPFTTTSSREARLAQISHRQYTFTWIHWRIIPSFTAQISACSKRLIGYHLWYRLSCLLPTATARSARHPEGLAA